MGNTISNTKIDDNYIGMSNGLTSVFIETICLAGATIAEEGYQKDIMIWLGQRDWRILGIGFEGFDIVDMPWDATIFDHQQTFILNVIDLAILQTNWELLNYTPHEIIYPTLASFREMIVNFRRDCIEPGQQFPIFEFEDRYDRCARHGVYLHCNGCVVCNNL